MPFDLDLNAAVGGFVWTGSAYLALDEPLHGGVASRLTSIDGTGAVRWQRPVEASVPASHQAVSSGLAWDGARAALVSVDPTTAKTVLRVLSPDTGEELQERELPTRGTIDSAIAGGDGRFAVVWSDLDGVHFIELSGNRLGAARLIQPPDTAEIGALIASPDGYALAYFTSTSENVALIDRDLQPTSFAVVSASSYFYPDGPWLAAVNGDVAMVQATGAPSIVVDLVRAGRRLELAPAFVAGTPNFAVHVAAEGDRLFIATDEASNVDSIAGEIDLGPDGVPSAHPILEFADLGIGPPRIVRSAPRTAVAIARGGMERRHTIIAQRCDGSSE